MRSKFLLVLATLAIGLFTSRFARAEDEVSFDYFYAALQDQGDWFGTDSYGYVFQPRAAAADRNWRPYTDGYWSSTDEGWTWISYEDFGWATYHYGRWTKLASVGWVWVPGYEWAPAWVSWRTSAAFDEDAPDVADQPIDPDSDYVGWAPLPPNVVLYPGVPLAGGIDQLFDIPPENYCFVPSRFFCAPALIVVIVAPARNYFCIGHTINVTHCRFGDQPGRSHIIYCGGPSFAALQRQVPRRIPQFTIVRQQGIPQVGRGSPAILNQVRGHTLEVIAPRIAPPAGVATSEVGIPHNASTPRPPKLKAEIARAQPVSGWNTAGVQAQAVQEVREQFKREAAQTPRPAVAPAPTQEAYRAQQEADLARRQQIIAEQQRRARERAAPKNEDARRAECPARPAERGPGPGAGHAGTTDRASARGPGQCPSPAAATDRSPATGPGRPPAPRPGGNSGARRGPTRGDATATAGRATTSGRRGPTPN